MASDDYSDKTHEKLQNFLTAKLLEFYDESDWSETNWDAVWDVLNKACMENGLFHGYKVSCEFYGPARFYLSQQDEYYIGVIWKPWYLALPERLRTYFNINYDDAPDEVKKKKKVNFYIKGIDTVCCYCTLKGLEKYLDEFPKIIEEFIAFRNEIEKQETNDSI